MTPSHYMTGFVPTMFAVFPLPYNSSSWSGDTNCAAYETANDGCRVQFSNPASFGPSFNNNQGGWYVLILSSHKDADSRHRYAIERSSSEIRMWFWPRNDGSVPGQVEFSSSHHGVEPDSWVRAFSNDALSCVVISYDPFTG